MNKIIENRINELRILCQKYDVQTMYLFGSASSEKFTELSDIDILITFKEISYEKYTDNFFELHKELTKLFNRKIDLLTDRSLSNPYFIESVEKTKILLYAA